MDIIRDAVRLVSQSRGDLVYFLVVLFALQQTLTAALGITSTSRSHPLVRRWMTTSIILLGGRILLILLGLLAIAGLLSSLHWITHLERWLLMTGILWVIWAAALGAHPHRAQTWGLIGLTCLSLLGYGYLALMAPPWAAWMEYLTIALAVALASILAAVKRPSAWEWLAGAMVFFGLGVLAQWVLGEPQSPVDGWMRLASLVGWPAVALLAQQQLTTLSAFPPEADIQYAARPPRAALLAEMIRDIQLARDLDATLILASSKLAQLFGVKVCAIGLCQDEACTQIRLVAVQPPTSAQSASPTFEIEAFPSLGQALSQGQPLALHELDEEATRTWAQALGLDEPPEALWLVPLSEPTRKVGVLWLGNGLGTLEWNTETQAEVAQVAEVMAISIARCHETPTSLETEFAEGAAAEAEPHWQQERAKFLLALERAKKQIVTLNQRIRVLVQEIKTRDEEILALNTELESRKPTVSDAELAVWQNEVRNLADERQALVQQIEDLTSERDALLEERGRLNEALAEVKREWAQIDEHRTQLEQELQRLRSGASDDAPEADHAEKAVVGPVGLVVADQDGQILSADALACQMLQLPQEHAVGTSLREVYPEPEWGQTVEALLSSEEEAPPRAHLTLSLNEHILEAELTTLRNRDGQVDGVVVTLCSSERMVEHHEAIIGLVNEFRTPMTAITGYTDLLLGEQGGILTEMQRKFVERIKANVEQLNYLLNDLVQATFSPDARPMVLAPEPVNLAEIIEEAIMRLEARFRERKVAVQLDLPFELPRVRADRDSLYQIMLHLLSNAVLCSKEGTQVVISAREESFAENNHHLKISVTDTGGGISPDDFPRVFRRHYRANQPLIQGMGETGIGMAMVKTLVEVNGGRVWVESEEGVGSTFSFLLPVEPEVTEHEE